MTLDWEHEASKLNYIHCAENARVIAAAGAVILKSALAKGIAATDIHIAGHSLGGQLMSMLAKQFKQVRLVNIWHYPFLTFDFFDYLSTSRD